MKYDEFLSIAEALSPQDRDIFVPLPGWCGMDRPIIDEIKGNLARITCREIIGHWIPMSHFRIDEGGKIYLFARTHIAHTQPSARYGISVGVLELLDQKLADHCKPQPPPVPANEATGEELKRILAHNEELKQQGDIDDQKIPF